MYHGIIQHKGFITEYLRDQILSRKLDQPIGLRPHLSRRARHDAARSTAGAVEGDAAQLVETLSHPNGWWRDTAQRLLVERGDPSVVPALTDRRRSAPRLAHAPARAVDARRHGRHRPADA